MAIERYRRRWLATHRFNFDWTVDEDKLESMMQKEGKLDEPVVAGDASDAVAKQTSECPKDQPTAGKSNSVDWHDPSIPVGNSPPLPRWPLLLSATLWLAWLGFLVVTALNR